MKLLRVVTIPLSFKALLTDQVKFMRSEGVDVTMVSAPGAIVEELTGTQSSPHFSIPLTRKYSPLTDLICLIKLIRIIKRLKPDIVHTHTPKAGLIGMLASKICAVPLRIHTIGGLPLMTAPAIKRNILILAERITSWASNYVLVNSPSILHHVKALRLSPLIKLDMIGVGSTNGVDLSKFSSLSVPDFNLENIKSSIHYNPNNCYLLTVGRVVKDKGIIEIINAFQQLSATRDNLRLILLGPIENERKEENLPFEILRMIRNHNDIIHISWSDNVAHYMSIADILVHASYREGCPNVILQAGAIKLPVICSQIPGNIDLISHRETGLLFEVQNTQDLVAKISFALTHKETIKEYSESLNKYISSNYDRTTVQNALLQFYKEKLRLIL